MYLFICHYQQSNHPYLENRYYFGPWALSNTKIYLMTGKHRLSTSENMLVSIQDKIKWADSMSEINKKHRKDVEEKVDEVKKSLFKVGWIYF
jgi:hypothetical protein